MNREAVTRAFFALSPADRRPETAEQIRALVSGDRVTPDMRDVVTRTIGHAVRKLHIDIELQWMVPPGYARPDDRRIPTPLRRAAFVEPVRYPTTIFVSPWMQEPVRTVLHESRHVWQWRQGWIERRTCSDPQCAGEYSLTPEQQDRLELDATVWAAEVIDELNLTEYASCEDRGLT